MSAIDTPKETKTSWKELCAPIIQRYEVAGNSSSNSSKFGIYYPGVGEYAPSRLISGRIQ